MVFFLGYINKAKSNATEYHVCNAPPKIEHFNGNDGLVKRINRLKELDLVLESYNKEASEAEDKLTRMEEIFQKLNVQTIKDEFSKSQDFKRQYLSQDSL